MSFSSNLINVANLPKDLQDRLKVSLQTEALDNIEETRLNSTISILMLESLITQQKITNRYLAEILGDTIEEDCL